MGGAPESSTPHWGTHPVLPLLDLVLLAPARLLQEGDLGGVLRELRSLRGGEAKVISGPLSTESICE